MKIFISGKITDDADYRGKFSRAEALLKAAYGEDSVVLNPAILPSGMTKEEYMIIGLRMLENADAIYMLADWRESNGATVEWAYAKYLEKNIYYQDAKEYTTDYNNLFDEEEVRENCTVQILKNTVTGDISVGWWEND